MEGEARLELSAQKEHSIWKRPRHKFGLITKRLREGKRKMKMKDGDRMRVERKIETSSNSITAGQYGAAAECVIIVRGNSGPDISPLGGERT